MGLLPLVLGLPSASFLDSEEPSLKLLRSAKLQCTNSIAEFLIVGIRNQPSFFVQYINYDINSLLLLRVGTRIIYNIYLSDGPNIPEVEMNTK